MKTMEFKVTGGGASAELSAFLASSLGVSRRKAKELLDHRKVWVNETRVWMARHRLRKGDVVRVLPPLDTARIRVLIEDSNLLVVDKPAGIVSNGENSLESRLRRERRDPGLRAAHRLDRDTSGCLLFARNSEILGRIVALFREHKVAKKYHAIIFGQPREREFDISVPMEGHVAVTRIRVLDSTRDASHVMALIETGRTHQIRRHLASVRYPVVGDAEYALPYSTDPRLLHVPRQMLHAAELAFPHPVSGETVRVSAPLPSDFRGCMKLFKLT
jgi:23S rRNA pseudouridine1911/1915/1917 synthase